MLQIKIVNCSFYITLRCSRPYNCSAIYILFF
uniref:Uncharacterized protein n=1 Tax=Arundo donax TaxID=35708 RepID=A0A0A9H768_ARUDO